MICAKLWRELKIIIDIQIGFNIKSKLLNKLICFLIQRGGGIWPYETSATDST